MGKKIYDWRVIRAYYEAGHTTSQTRAAFGLYHATFAKAIKSGKVVLRPDEPRSIGTGNCKYDWTEIQRYHDAGHGYASCQERFGFASLSWYKANKSGKLRARRRPAGPRPVELEQVLRSGSRLTIKRNLLKLGILENRCGECGLTEWRGKPLAIQIDHRNGIRDDNRLENLRMLCPNCHSQTETFAARNLKTMRSRVV